MRLQLDGLECDTRIKTALARLVERIKEEPQVVRLILFGSQARGDATEASDVDLLVVADGHIDYWDMRDRIDKMLGLKRPTIFIELPSMIRHYGRIRGRYHYYAVHEGVVLYERHDAEQIIGDVREAGHDEQASHWLWAAGDRLEGVIKSENKVRHGCLSLYQSIQFSIKALLAHDRVDYWFTHDLDELNGLLPNPLERDLSRASEWHHADGNVKPDGAEYTIHDVDYGIRIASEIYEEAKNRCAAPVG